MTKPLHAPEPPTEQPTVSSTAERYRALAAKNPKFRVAPQTGTGIVIVGERQRED
jgi:hypothetical protein